MKEKCKSILIEFKKFIERGNVVELAVGVVIGKAFSDIVNSLVSDMLMPVIGIILGKINFTGLVLPVGEAQIKYGQFINNIINFLVIAVCVFALVQVINKITKKKEVKEEKSPVQVEPPKSKEEILLEEILKELKKNNKKNNK